MADAADLPDQKQVPGRRPDGQDEIFHVLYDLDDRFQVRASTMFTTADL